MLDLFKIVREQILSDNTITDYIGDRVYLAFKPVGNTENDYPQITLTVKDGETDSLDNDYFPELQIHIWVKGEGSVTKGHLIAKQILLNLDVSAFTDPCIYQIWKDGSVDMFEDDTQTFHKVIIFNVVMRGYN